MTYPRAVPDVTPTPPPVPAAGPPPTVRAAGALTALEGLTALLLAAVLVVRELGGSGDRVISGYGTAAWFAAIGAGLLAAGVSLVRGRRGGRAPAAIVQVVLLPVVWSLLTDSGRPVLGALLGVIVVAVLVLLFVPSSVAWTGERFAEEHPPVPDAPVRPHRPVSARVARPRRGSPGRNR